MELSFKTRRDYELFIAAAVTASSASNSAVDAADHGQILAQKLADSMQERGYFQEQRDGEPPVQLQRYMTPDVGQSAGTGRQVTDQGGGLSRVQYVRRDNSQYNR